MTAQQARIELASIRQRIANINVQLSEIIGLEKELSQLLTLLEVSNGNEGPTEADGTISAGP